MTLRHVVLFQWNGDVPADHADAVSAALAGLPGAIPEIRAYQFGPDAGLVPGNGDYAVVADFDDSAGYFTYRQHPAHQKFIDDHITGKVASRMSVQFDLT